MRASEGTMRLDTDASKRPQSPLHSYSNGSTELSPVTSPTLSKDANGSSLTKTQSNGSSASYTNGHTARPTGPYFGHDREEVTRILIQGLTDLGYHGAARKLSQESGHELEGPTVAAFRNAVLQGDWPEAEALLFGTQHIDDGGGGVGITDGSAGYDRALGKAKRSSWAIPQYSGGLRLAEGANKHEMLFWLRQQKYLELLEEKDLGAALLVLRQELTPLHTDKNRLHMLSSLMMCQSVDDMKLQAQWDGAAGESRSRLLSDLSRSISPSVMIPEHRLAVLLDEVKESWIENCPYHNTAASPSLYVDHMCDRENFPLTTVLELRDHTDEVWHLAFSHDGSRLATASKDHTVIIYDTTSFKVLHKLPDHASGVCYIAWSPDDSKLITCTHSPDSCSRIWDTRTGQCILTSSPKDYPVTSAAWAPDGTTFVIGSQDSEDALCVWNLENERVHRWQQEPNLRVHDLAVSPDGRRLVVLLDTRILVYDFVSREKLWEWAVGEQGEEMKGTSVCVSSDSRRMLVSMNRNRIKLMAVDTGEVLQVFEGHRQVDYIIRSAFGGAGENFVVSGSEDSRIFIWRTNGHPVEVLEAHKPGCVNAIAWNPRDPCMFASAGDDHRVRIWSKPSAFSSGFRR